MPMNLPEPVRAELTAGLRKAIDLMEGGSADAEHAALYSLATSVAELLDVSFDSYVSTTDTTGQDDPAYLALLLIDAGLTGVTVGPYGSFPVVITGIFPAGGDAGLHVFRVAESLADGRAHSTTQDRLSEPLWAGIFEPNAAGWVTSPIEAWDGLTVAQVRDKITGYL